MVYGQESNDVLWSCAGWGCVYICNDNFKFKYLIKSIGEQKMANFRKKKEFKKKNIIITALYSQV